MFEDVLKVISTTKDKLNDIPVEYGQLIFTRDDRAIYLDTNERSSYQAIIVLNDDTFRLSMKSPVNGFYFVIETGAIWRYDSEAPYIKWFQVTKPPKENIVFDDNGNFPEVGSSDTLYVDKDVIYRYIDGEYVVMNQLKWGNFK